MSQFDIHENHGKNADAIPFVVVVQSSAFDDRRSRIVVPLVKTEKASANVGMVTSRLNPTFAVDGIQVTLHTLQIISVPLDALGKRVGSLTHEADAIIEALPWTKFSPGLMANRSLRLVDPRHHDAVRSLVELLALLCVRADTAADPAHHAIIDALDRVEAHVDR